MNLGNHPKLRVESGLLIGKGQISWFGGPKDVASGQDNGSTRSGYSTLDHPYAPYCSLPRVYWEKYSLEDFQKVTVEYKSRQVECFLVDVGPGGTPEADTRLIDVSEYVLKRLGCDTDETVTIYIPKGQIVRPEKRY